MRPLEVLQAGHLAAAFLCEHVSLPLWAALHRQQAAAAAAERDLGAARGILLRAAEMLEGEPLSMVEGESALIMADVMRRAGEWDRARRSCLEGLRQNVDRRLLASFMFELELIAARDLRIAHVADATAWSKNIPAPEAATRSAEIRDLMEALPRAEIDLGACLERALAARYPEDAPTWSVVPPKRRVKRAWIRLLERVDAAARAQVLEWLRDGRVDPAQGLELFVRTEPSDASWAELAERPGTTGRAVLAAAIAEGKVDPELGRTFARALRPERRDAIRESTTSKTDAFEARMAGTDMDLSEATRRVEAAWEELQRTSITEGWSLRVTPPLVRGWWKKGGTQYSVYGFAGRDLDASCSAEVSRAFVRVDFVAGSEATPEVVRLSSTLESAGSQPLRPLSPELVLGLSSAFPLTVALANCFHNEPTTEELDAISLRYA